MPQHPRLWLGFLEQICSLSEGKHICSPEFDLPLEDRVGSTVCMEPQEVGVTVTG